MLITVLRFNGTVALSSLATGGEFKVTVTVAVSVPPLPSETWYVNLSVPKAELNGVYVTVSGEVELLV